MNSEFEDFENDLEGLENELPDFDIEFDDFDIENPELDVKIDTIEFSDVKTRTALLAKNDMFALLCLKTANEGGAICRVDPREINPAVQLYDDPQKALDWYSKSLRTSRENGWNVVYDGLPLEG